MIVTHGYDTKVPTMSRDSGGLHPDRGHSLTAVNGSVYRGPQGAARGELTDQTYRPDLRPNVM